MANATLLVVFGSYIHQVRRVRRCAPFPSGTTVARTRSAQPDAVLTPDDAARVRSNVLFRVLGEVEVVAGDRVLSFTRRRERCLLGILLLEPGRTLPVERLIDLLWEEVPPAHARRMVQSHVARIRAALAPSYDDVPLVTRGAGYALQVDPDTVDAHRFRTLVAQASASPDLAARADLFGTALGLWKGPLLGDDASEALRIRVGADLEELYLSTLEKWLAALVDTGQYGEALPQLASLTVERPTQSRLVKLQMTALYRTGRKAEALAAYERSRSWLVDHLGIDPTPELSALHQAILRDEVESRGAAEIVAAGSSTRDPHQAPAELPVDAGWLVGRDHELATLETGLVRDRAPTTAMVTAITGTAGVGKTALAVHFGHTIVDHYPDGQLFLNLRGHAQSRPLTPHEALSRLLSSLGVPAERIPQEEDAAAALYRSQLAGRLMLVLLDNAGSAAQVRPLLPADPGCLTVITSRDRLAGLVVSHGVRRLVLDVLEPDDAVGVLADLVGPDRLAAEAEAAGRLAELCSRLPLALRIAGASLSVRPQWAIADYVAQMEDDRLGALEADGIAAVQAAVTLSYAQLEAETQRLFRLLGLVPGPDITIPAATALCGIDVGRAARQLDRLAAAHLVQEHKQGRYYFSDLMRVYAGAQADRVDAEPARRAASQRLGEWYLSTATRAAVLAYPQVARLPATEAWAGTADPDLADLDATTWLDEERENLVAAVVHAAAHGPRHLSWLLADTMRGFFLFRMHLADWQAVAVAACGAAELEDDVPGRAAAALSLATVRSRQSRFAESIADHEAAVSLSECADWPAGVATAQNNLATVYLDRGELRQADPHLRAALVTYRRIGHRLGEGVVVGNLGGACLRLGRLREAADHLRHAVALHGRDTFLTATPLKDLAIVCRLVGRLDEALDHTEEAMALYRGAGHRLGEAIAEHTIATIHRDAGRLDRALEHALAAERLAREIASEYAEADALNVTGTVYTALSRYDEAVDAHQRALREARRADMRYQETEALLGLGSAYGGLGRYDEAASYAMDAVTVARGVGYRVVEGEALTIAAELCRARGDRAGSVEQAESALAIHRETGYRRGEERTLALLEPPGG